MEFESKKSITNEEVMDTINVVEDALTKRRGEEDDDDEEEDGFGDFEEAPPKQAEDDYGKKKLSDEPSGEGTSNSPYQQVRLSPTLFRKSLTQLIESAESSIWELGAVREDMFQFAYHSRPTPFDLFPQMDSGSSNIDIRHFNQFMLKAHQLWTQFCYVEEAPALNFRWNSSLLNQRLLWALHLQQQKARTRKFPIEKRQQKGGGEGRMEGQTEQQMPTANTANGHQPAISSSGQIDSLMVPPADFDWRQSGLANPLTGQTVTTRTPVFDCNFLLEGTEMAAGPANGATSILEKDPAAFRLVSDDEATNSTAAPNSTMCDGGTLSMLDVAKLDGFLLAAQKQESSVAGPECAN